MDTQTNKIFKFSDPRQLRIHERLMRVGPGPASFYRDACSLMENNINLESKTHLIAHLLREIESSLRSVMKPFDYMPPEKCEKCGNRPEGHRTEIKSIITLYDLEKSGDVAKLWLQLADQQTQIGLARRAHRNALGSPREADKDFTDLWENMEILLDVLLDKMESNYLGYISTLDGLLAKISINKNDVQALLQHVPNNNVTLSYFFEKLEQPGWLKPLAEKDFFKNPPLPIVHPDSGTSFPFWPQAQYLRKMAQLTDQQGEVLAICLDVKTDNVRSKGDLLDIALLLPADMSIQILNSIDDIDSWFGPEKYGKLINYLSRQGKTSEALALANKLLVIQPDPRKAPEYDGHKIPHDPVALIRDWDYEQIMEKDFPALVDVAGLNAIKVLLDQIENYISYSNIGRESGSKDDYSEIWRPAIEDHSQNNDHAIKDILVNSARDASERFLNRHPDQVNTLVTELEKRKLLIFDRLILHLLRLFPKGAEEKITQLLLNKEEFSGSQRLTHEYFLLAKTHSSILTEPQRKEVWSWIVKGPDVDMEAYKARCKENGIDPSDEQVEKYIKNWQMYHLMPFKDTDLEWKKYFDELVTTIGEPEFPSFSSWSHGGSWGPSSGLSGEQFKEMKPSEVIEYLKTWEPPANDPLDTSREGTSRELTAQIANDPEKWLESIPLFNELDPTYVRSAFTGYRDALRQSKKFDWKPILDLGEIILSKPLEITDRKPSGFFGDDPDWSWCRNTIVELITEGFKNTDGKIPLDLREKTWLIVETLTNDSDPTPEREKEYLASHRDPLSAAINSTRGDAIDAAIQYGVWLKNSVEKSVQPVWGLAENAPELLGVLNNHLDIAKDPSLGIRALYGEKLGALFWLDEKWVEENQGLIFPDKPELQNYFDAAWETYITFVPAYDVMFKALMPQYKRAIKEIGSHTDGKHHLENPEQNLAHHLTIFYWRGLIAFETEMLTEFYKLAPVELKAEVIEFMGRSGKEDKEIPKEVKERFTSLIERRIFHIKENRGKGEEQEFQGFSWLVASEKFDDKWVLDRLFEILELGCDIEGDHLVIERFVTLAPQYPLEVINCAELMVQNDKKGWGIPDWGEGLSTVIKSVLESDNEDAKIKAKEFIHRLGAKGHLRYKELLPSNS